MRLFWSYWILIAAVYSEENQFLSVSSWSVFSNCHVINRVYNAWEWKLTFYHSVDRVMRSIVLFSGNVNYINSHLARFWQAGVIHGVKICWQLDIFTFWSILDQTIQLSYCSSSGFGGVRRGVVVAAAIFFISFAFQRCAWSAGGFSSSKVLC